MSTLIRAVQHSELTFPGLWQGESRSRLLRFAIVALLALLVAGIPGMADAAATVLYDAYAEIAVFVAATLFLIHGAEHLLKTDIGDVLSRNPRWQVPAGALLGAFPGCGGAIVAVTQFTRGRMSFGGLVATLMATGGDAMFLLIAAEPLSATLVLALAVGAAIPFGYALDAIHGAGFLRPSTVRAAQPCAREEGGPSAPLTAYEKVWLAVMAPVAAIAIPVAVTGVELSGTLASAVTILAMAGVVLGIAGWVKDGEPEYDDEAAAPSAAREVIGGTNFVLFWAALAMLAYEGMVLVSGIDPTVLLGSAGILLPLAAILIGFIPGCGPQVMLTSLYISGAAPFSAQLGNAISTDGDALFPAIAVAPKAAIAATFYSAIPAVVLGLGWYALFEI